MYKKNFNYENVIRKQRKIPTLDHSIEGRSSVVRMYNVVPVQILLLLISELIQSVLILLEQLLFVP